MKKLDEKREVSSSKLFGQVDSSKEVVVVTNQLCKPTERSKTPHRTRNRPPSFRTRKIDDHFANATERAMTHDLSMETMHMANQQHSKIMDDVDMDTELEQWKQVLAIAEDHVERIHHNESIRREYYKQIQYVQSSQIEANVIQ
jgi:hypothetical protein